MDSNVGLAIQCVGILLIALLSFFTMRSVGDASQKYWTAAWVCLALSLSSLLMAFRGVGPKEIFYPLYFLGEYAFCLLLIAGCRNYSTGARLDKRHAFALVPATATAFALPYVSTDFNDLFIAQASIMACFFAVAYVALGPARRRDRLSLGVRVMSVALVLLAINFLHYVPVFGARESPWGIAFLARYLKYTSVVDLILEIMLGFGTVMVSLEGVRREVEAANRDLTEARDKLEMLVRVDPLTEALNRHAFHSLLSKDGGEMDGASNVSGCVAVIDLDNLKPINDSLGHAAGDKAIRAVASAIRSIIRADDLLFRWGGDEFLVLLFGLPEHEARRRLDTLNARLAREANTWMPDASCLTVSHGLAGFDALAQLHDAIERADEAMYRSKQARKAEIEVSAQR